MSTPILVGDVGGTNTRLALVTRLADGWEIEARATYSTADLTGMGDALELFLSHRRRRTQRLRCCLSGAGPVRDNVSYLSNVDWTIDGSELASTFDMNVLVINDFSAICYGLPFLYQNDTTALARVPHTDGSSGTAEGSVWAAVGAGTGLGIGYLVTMDGRHLALPSEGGHSDFGAFDAESRALKHFVSERLGCVPGAEQFVSGQGIVNTFEYLSASGRFDRTDATAAVDAAPTDDKPAVVSSYASTDPCCREAMRLFVRNYGRVASSAALHYLPSTGVYLAGGIAAKNEALFTKEPTFMETFEDNYKASVRPFLKRCPVFIVKDEAVALYGAAHAAEQFLEGDPL